MRNIFPQSMVNGIGGGGSSSSTSVGLASAPGAQHQLTGASSNAYFSPSSNNFPYGGPGRGQPGSGTASSLSSMFSNVANKDLRPYEGEYAVHSLQTGGQSGVLKSSSTTDASRFMAVGGNQSTPSSSGVTAVKSLQQQQYQQMTGTTLETSSQQQQSLSSLNFHDNEFPSLTANRSAAANAASGSRSAASRTGAAGYGSITGIPAGMLNDQFGMVGLVACLRAIESDPTIIPLALGHDLTTLGLNLNAVERNLYQNFGGPWADSPCRPQDIDYCVPPEYLTNANIMDKLSPIKLNRYTDDLLFYLFYNFGGEAFQLAAAAELYNRDWRYHKEEKCWITRASGQAVVERTAMHERGTYFVFDATHWRKVPKEMTLEYDKLEERPMLPPQQQQSQPQQQQQQATPAIVNTGNVARNA
uniref:NOT2/NOT3/NOT5 C-terminal domain-containing protein n=1 Tax=Romanomermis culicivorax TaxID=13658 RepID=A0A915HXQ9_ROMCU